MQTVSHAYCIGITEGRAFWRQLEKEGRANLETAREALATSEQCLAMGFGGDIRDSIRGERDFWRQRIKLLAEQRAREGAAA
jgi:hypothetical protein